MQGNPDSNINTSTKMKTKETQRVNVEGGNESLTDLMNGPKCVWSLDKPCCFLPDPHICFLAVVNAV